MKAFDLPKPTEATLAHVNLRQEFHGDESVLAIDLTFTKDGPADLLDLLDDHLRTTLFCNRAATAGQAALPEVMAVLPNLRLPQLNAQKFAWAKGEKYGGYTFVQDFGLGGESDLRLNDCTVGGFKFETLEGGRVTIGWTVQCSGDQLTPDVRARLTGHIGEDVFVTLTPPPVMQLVKGGKKKPETAAEASENLLDLDGGEDDDGDDSEVDTPEKALARAAGG